MPKFILIDHSIRKYGGHYYEYAINVLEAAKGKKYEVFLATNKEFKSEEDNKDFHIFPEYEYDFWGIKKTSKDLSYNVKCFTSEGIFGIRDKVKNVEIGSTSQCQKVNKYLGSLNCRGKTLNG